jgi:hypothetical protein
MVRAWGLVLGVAFGVTVAGGCGSGGGNGKGGGTPVSTSVPGSKRLSDLTPTELTQLCADLQAWAMSGPFLTDGCNASAWLGTFGQATLETSATDADLQAACETLYAGCVANGVTSMCSSVPATCTATVSEYTTCASDSIAQLAGLPACSAVTRASLPANIARISAGSTSAACAAVQSKCPGVTM